MGIGRAVIFLLFAFASGLCLLAAVFLPDSWRTRLAQRTLSRLRESTVAQLRRSPRLPWLATVYGVTTPGPGGMVTAPLSGEACVWYRLRITHTVARGESTMTYELLHRSEGAPIGVDDGTGKILVDADLLDRPLLGSDPPGLVEYSPATDDVGAQLRTLHQRGVLTPGVPNTSGVSVEEAYVRAGRQVLVLGHPHRWREWTMLDAATPMRCGVSLESLASLRQRPTDEINYESSALPAYLGLFGAVLGVCAAMLGGWI
jgi:hypothetical protein